MQRTRGCASQSPGVEAHLGDSTFAVGGDEVRSGAVGFGDGLDEFRAVVEDACAVVGRVGGGQRSVANQTLKEWSPLRLRVVVHAIGEWHEAKSVGHGSKGRPERVRGAPPGPKERTGPNSGGP